MTYLHTLRHLKPVQVYGRLRRHLPRRTPRAEGTWLPRPALGPWREPIHRAASLLGPDRFVFLNQERHLRGAADWNDQATPRLWLYHLHSFDDLNAVHAPRRKSWHAALIERWIAENPPGAGAGWEPYPLSRRIVNWIQWALAGNRLPSRAVESLAAQAAHLERNVEYHLLGNHLLVNAKALLFAGVFFTGAAAGRWLSLGTSILARELDEQILADGAHFERSPMYHGLVLEDLLDLINVTAAHPGLIDASLARDWRRKAQAMLDWLALMSHPDRRIAFFNDAAFGVAGEPEQLGHYARRLEIPWQWPGSGALAGLAASGYFRLSRGETTILIDAGEIGPDYQPGHAHADTLSLELSHRGRRLLVNSGTSTYEPGVERGRQRGTPAHNTVAVDGQDQSEVWASFRVARRARPQAVTTEESAAGVMLEAAHDGYTRLPDPVTHRRRVELTADGVKITDMLEAAGSHRVEIYFHWHPDLRLLSEGRAIAVDAREGGELARIELDPALEPSLESTTYHPEFGLSLPNTTLRGSWLGRCPVSFVTFLQLP